MSFSPDPSKASPTSDECKPETASGTIMADTKAFFDNYSNAAAPLNLIHTHCARVYLDQLDADNPPTPALVEQQLLALTNTVIKRENLKFDKGDTRYPRPGRTRTMLKLIFGGIILMAVVAAVFFVGFVLGTTVSPLAGTGG